VLSQYPFQHGINLRQTYPTALYQTGNKLDVAHHFTVNRTSVLLFFRDWFRQTVLLTARGIQILFLFLALFGPVIFGASLV
jgi:hypothetical protein